MKKLGVYSFLAISALVLLCWVSPLAAHADTVTLTLENVGPGNNSGGVSSALRKSDPLVLARSAPGQEQHLKR